MSEMAAGAAPAAGNTNPGAVPGVPGQTAVTSSKEPANGTQQQAAKPSTPELYEVKVNGQTRKYTLDQLKTLANLGSAATERFQQASEKERKHDTWKQTAQKDFMQALQDPELGLSREQIRDRFENWYKENFIDPETMTKEQREALETKKERDRLKSEKEENENKYKTWQEQQQIEVAKNQLQQEIIQTLEQAGLPKTRFTASRLAFWKQQNLKQGYDAPAEVLIQQVRDEGQNILKAFTAEATPEQLVEFLGDELIKKIRKYDVEKLKARYGAKEAPAPSPTPGRTQRGGGKSMREVDQYFNNLRRSK